MLQSQLERLASVCCRSGELSQPDSVSVGDLGFVRVQFHIGELLYHLPGNCYTFLYAKNVKVSWGTPVLRNSHTFLADLVLFSALLQLLCCGDLRLLLSFFTFCA